MNAYTVACFSCRRKLELGVVSLTFLTFIFQSACAWSDSLLAVNSSARLGFSSEIKTSGNLNLTPSTPPPGQLSQVNEVIIVSNFKSLSNADQDDAATIFRMSKNKENRFIPGELIHILVHVYNSSDRGLNKHVRLSFSQRGRGGKEKDIEWLEKHVWDIPGQAGSKDKLLTNGVVPSFPDGEYEIVAHLSDTNGHNIHDIFVPFNIDRSAPQNLFLDDLVLSNSRELKRERELESIETFYYRLRKTSTNIFYPGGTMTALAFFSAANVSLSSKGYGFDWRFISPSGHILSFDQFRQGEYPSEETPPIERGELSNLKTLKNRSFNQITLQVPTNIDSKWYGRWVLNASLFLDGQTIIKESPFTIFPTSPSLVSYNSFRKGYKHGDKDGKPTLIPTWERDVRGKEIPVLISRKSLKILKDENANKSYSEILDQLAGEPILHLQSDENYFLITNAEIHGIDSSVKYNAKLGVSFADFSKQGKTTTTQLSSKEGMEIPISGGNMFSETRFTVPSNLVNKCVALSSVWIINDVETYSSPPVWVHIVN